MAAIKYIYDPTSILAANKIVDEVHTVVPGDPHLLVPREGSFYTNTVALVEVPGGTILTLGVDYGWVSIDPYIVAETGIEAANGILLTNQLFVGDIKITYQVVGGWEGQSNALHKDLIDALENVGTVGVSWADIVGKPALFPPAAHVHELSTLTELELLTLRLNELQLALVDRVPSVESGHDLQQQLDRLLRILAEHRNAINNIIAVTGTGALLSALITKVDNYSLYPSNTVSASVAGVPVEIGRWDASALDSITGVVVFKDSVNSHTASFTIASDGFNSTTGQYGDIMTNGAIFTLDTSIVGGDIILTCTPSLIGEIKTKIVTAF